MGLGKKHKDNGISIKYQGVCVCQSGLIKGCPLFHFSGGLFNMKWKHVLTQLPPKSSPNVGHISCSESSVELFHQGHSESTSIITEAAIN